MAFDTVIDKTKLETEITATANAIREKTGNTELLEWLNNTGFADDIGAIETGGGDGFIIREVIPATSSYQIVISGTAEEIFGISEMPHIVIAGWCRADGAINKLGAIFGMGVSQYFSATNSVNVNATPHYCSSNGGSLTRGAMSGIFAYSMNDNMLKLSTYSGSSSAHFQAGVKYLYFFYPIGGN